jgi:hypothetical protein
VHAWALRHPGVPLIGNLMRMTVLALNRRTVVVQDFGVRIIRKATRRTVSRPTDAAG